MRVPGRLSFSPYPSPLVGEGISIITLSEIFSKKKPLYVVAGRLGPTPAGFPERPLLRRLQLRPILRKVCAHMTCFRIGHTVFKPTNAVASKHGPFFSLHAAVWRTGKRVNGRPAHPYCPILFDWAFKGFDCARVEPTVKPTYGSLELRQDSGASFIRPTKRRRRNEVVHGILGKKRLEPCPVVAGVRFFKRRRISQVMINHSHMLPQISADLGSASSGH